MNTKQIAIGSAVVLVLGAAVAGWIYWPKYQLQSLVKQGLIDPDSARFSAMHYSAATGGACGRVNSKNRMGGYAGDTEFAVTKDGTLLFRPNEENETAALDARIHAMEKVIEYLKFTGAVCPELLEAKPSKG